jgi:NuA3 HAT complex component NTO1
MKSGGGQNTLMDQASLRAYCHQHTPNDWRSDHNTDRVYDNTVRYCKEHFRGQVWADSRASALAINDNRDTPTNDKGPVKVTLTNRKGQKQKTIWRLPSGAPVIPEVILRSIEDSLVRFSVAKKKEYVSEICKYWTLKREARRGAALLKRLQLQMDTFSSFEVTRRDYKAQGAAGRHRLDRRIALAETLEEDLERIRQICDLIKQREAEKLQEARLLKDLIDIVYFPIPPLLAPVIEKALKHDRGTFRDGLVQLQAWNKAGQFTSVTEFSSNLVQIFAEVLGSEATTFGEIVQQVTGRAEDMAQEQRDRRAQARRVLKSIQPQVEDALRKEAELTGRPYAQQMKELDEALQSRRGSLADSGLEIPIIETNGIPTINGVTHEDVEMPDVDEVRANGNANGTSDEVVQSVELGLQPKLDHAANTPPASTNGIRHDHIPNHNALISDAPNVEPPTPPLSLQGQGKGTTNIGLGGIPWYVETFDPEGTSISEERWTGKDVLRDMSEELSEMDEDELQGLGHRAELDLDVRGAVGADDDGGLLSPKRALKKGKKPRGNDWGERSFRQRRWR